MPVPSYMFNKAWLAGNVLIPADDTARFELRDKLNAIAHTGAMTFPENKQVRLELEARIAAIKAYSEVKFKGR